MKPEYQMFMNKRISPEEFAELMDAVGWVNDEECDLNAITRSLHHYPFVAHMRDEHGILVGYISAFSDEVFSTFIGELVVHPLAQRQGVGSQLLQAVERQYSGIPMYIQSFENTKAFFLKHGYREPKRKMIVVSKKNAIGMVGCL